MSGYWPLAGEANKLAEKGVLVDGMPQVPIIIIIIIIVIIIIIFSYSYSYSYHYWMRCRRARESLLNPEPETTNNNTK